jgi:ABC-type lipoprotein export system ATPase subunit
MLTDLNIIFPKGELSLVCGKLGSGKTLLLLGTYWFCHGHSYLL